LDRLGEVRDAVSGTKRLPTSPAITASIAAPQSEPAAKPAGCAETTDAPTKPASSVTTTTSTATQPTAAAAAVSFSASAQLHT
jgi:hypothetical protein